jgi:glucosyl-3-phosphoglycerate synthase
MSDLYQPGEIATIHKFDTSSVDNLERKLIRYTKTNPIALVLPALNNDFFSQSNETILNILKEVTLINEVVYTLGGFSSEEEFLAAKKKLHDIENVKFILLWTDGPRIQALFELLNENGLRTGGPGKGRSVWIAYGYVLAKNSFSSIVLHDCDVTTYDKEFLLRLCLPVTVPYFDYEFCKGFYGRFGDRLYGRVTRLFVFPLLQSLISTIGHEHFLLYLASFKYPLAGEFAMSTNLARTIRIPSDWGLEVGTLAEVYRKCSARRICQIELCDRYDHKHQELSPEDKTRGLHKMSIDIARSIFTTLASLGVNIEDKMRSIRVSYLRYAQDIIRKYDADSYVNDLYFDRHHEEVAVETFSEALKYAGQLFLDDPLGVPEIPNWSRVNAALPDFSQKLIEAVHLDNEEALYQPLLRTTIAEKRSP